MKRGFTLMEMLVVVIIIGVLAAVAMPMYKRSTQKAAALEVTVWLKAVGDSMDRFLTLNRNFKPGTDAFSFEDLDVNIKMPKGYNCALDTGYKAFRCDKEKDPYTNPTLWKDLGEIAKGGSTEVVCGSCEASACADKCIAYGFTEETETSVYGCYAAGNYESSSRCYKRP